MTPVEQRFLTGYREADTAVPGLVLEDDGTVWLVNPDGTREQVSGGGGGAGWDGDDPLSHPLEARFEPGIDWTGGIIGSPVRVILPADFPAAEDAYTVVTITRRGHEDDLDGGMFEITADGSLFLGTADGGDYKVQLGQTSFTLPGGSFHGVVTRSGDGIEDLARWSVPGHTRWLMGPDGALSLKDNGFADIFRIDVDGTVHIKNGTTIQADL